MIYQKQKGLPMNSENLAKIYVTETKIVSLFSLARGTEKNPPRKSAHKAGMLLKTNGEKMPVYWLAKILLKINEL